jgi:hypothetical protein
VVSSTVGLRGEASFHADLLDHRWRVRGHRAAIAGSGSMLPGVGESVEGAVEN